MLPFTRTRVNLPAELAAAGVERLVLAPGGDGLAQLREWRIAAARVVAEGLPRRRALEAMTLEPARALGQDGKVQALKAGAPANFTVWSGDPLDPMARALFVVRDGKVVWDYEREKREEER
jgi:imidazolonepropionase-like amidohydrolase